MKITGYTQSVTNVGGSSGTPTLNASAQMKAVQSQAIDMTPVANGIGKWVDTINAIHEQEDKENILAAMYSYNKGMDNLLNNENNGLLRTKEQGAQGIVDSYVGDADKLRTDTLGSTKLHFRSNQAALDNFFNKAAQQGFEQVRDHQYKQSQIVRSNHFANIKASLNNNAVNNYSSITQLQGYKNQLGAAVDVMYGDYGDERVQLERQKAFGEFASNALQTAIANNDYGAQHSIYKAFGNDLSPEAKARYEKLSFAKQRNQWKFNTTKSIVDAGGSLADMIARAKGIKTRSVENFAGGDSSLVDIVRNKMKNAPYRLNDKNSKEFFGQSMSGTSCMATMGFGPLKNTPYANQYNVDQAVATAEKLKQLIPGDSGYKPQAGDLAVVNDGGHIVMITEKGGTIQNGKSGNGGQGGVWESDVPVEQMFGKVKYYIRTSDYNNAASGKENVDVSPEENDELVKAVIAEYNNRKVIKNANTNSILDNVKQNVYNERRNNANYSYNDALQTYANMQNFADADEYNAAVAGVNAAFGKRGKNTTGVKSPDGVRKGGAQATYAITQLIEQGEFSHNKVKLAKYLNSEDCSSLTDAQIAGLFKTFDEFENKTGAYKFNMAGIDSQVLNGVKYTAEEKEKALAAARGGINELLRNWVPAQHENRQKPTESEIIKAGQKAIEETYNVSYKQEGIIYNSNVTMKIPKGIMYNAGFLGGAEQKGDIVNLYIDYAKTKSISVSVDAFKAMFPTYVK